jgi:uncharacterized SAM-binding protein YcdF (DUF218 family)/glycosyltransferase involved in cell wall biosynthesis
MIKGENIVCISSIDWDFVWQGHQEIMSSFARNGNKVLFIENTGVRTPNFSDLGRIRKRAINWLKSVRGFRKESDNLYIYSPVILPFPYSRLTRWLNKRLLLGPIHNWMKAVDFNNPIIWTFLPTGTAMDIISGLQRKLLVYYCIADFSELTDRPKAARIVEDNLIKECDLIFAQGEILAERCRSLNNNVHIFPFGVSDELFENTPDRTASIAEDIASVKSPVIGYVGGVHRHVDFGLLRFIAESRPEWSIVMIGPKQTEPEELKDMKNIYFLGKKEFAKLPRYILRFDACLIPYLKTEYTATVYPTKLNEYHAFGKPVISTDLPEVRRFNQENGGLVYIAADNREFVNNIELAIAEKDESLAHKRVLSAKRNSWKKRIEEMSSLIITALNEKASFSVDWRKNFLKVYRSWRRRIVIPVFIAIASYLLIFYTDLAWIAAAPLKISQAPRNADCILVFAGGVGESGHAGQGYEERVQYAVDLYKSGFAKHIIFSSGYSYLIREPFLMKSLAVSLGIPEKDILLEEKATNTYENVLFSKEIAENNRWKDILLVSSPYNMLRVKLVFNKIAKDLDVCYTPIPRSLFYARVYRDESGRKVWKRVELRQILAIIHEYLAILYYRLKGWA